MSSNVESNVRQDFDEVIQKIIEFVYNKDIDSSEAYTTARYCLMDTIGCGLLALNFKDCEKLLGPYVEGPSVPNGVRVPGTKYTLVPV